MQRTAAAATRRCTAAAVAAFETGVRNGGPPLGVVMRSMICNTPSDNDDDDGDDDGWITLARAACRLIERLVPFDGAAGWRAIPVQGRLLRASGTQWAISQLFPVGQSAVATFASLGRGEAGRPRDVSTDQGWYRRTEPCLHDGAAGHGYGDAKPSVL